MSDLQIKHVRKLLQEAVIIGCRNSRQEAMALREPRKAYS